MTTILLGKECSTFLATDDPDTAFTPVGAPGKFWTVTALDAADAGPVPTAFVARTVHA